MHRIRTALLAGFAWLAIVSSPASAIQWCSEVSASGGVAACGDIQARDIIVGLTPAEVRELMRELFAQDSAAVQKVEELSKQLGVTEPALKRFLSDLGQGDVPIEELPSRLAEIAKRYKNLLAQLETTSSTDPEVQRLKGEARSALDAGDFARTEELLNRAKARDLAAIEQMQAAVVRLQADLDARQLSAAEAAAQNGDLMMTQIRYADAARYCAEAVGLTPETRADYLSERLRAWAIAARRAGDFPTGLAAAERALILDEGRLPATDALLAIDLNNLAGLYQDTGRYAQAEPLYQRALTIREKALGSEHPDVAQSLNNLAGLYQDTGRYAQAEPLLKRTLAIAEKALDPEHPDLAIGLNNLALLYRATGRYAQAEPLYQRALAIGEKTLGPEHPTLANPLDNLAGLYQNTGRYAQAEPLYQRAIAIDEKTLGPEHPTLATRLNNLAELYRATGRYAQAEPLYQRAIAIDEKALGLEHPGLATDLNNLALLYQDTGRYAQAEPLYQRAIVILDKSLPPDHPSLATIRENYAILLDQLGRGGEASEFRAQTDVIRQRRNRPPSPPSP